MGSSLNARALWAGLGCQNHEPGWAEPWETLASSPGRKQGLRKSLRGLQPVASKHEKLLLNMRASVPTCVCTGVYLCALGCVCLRMRAHAHPHRPHRLLRVPQLRRREGHAQARSTQLRSTTQSRPCLLAPAQSSPTSRARRPAPARHAPPCPPDEATGHSSVSYRAHGRAQITQHTHAPVHAHLCTHTQRHTHTPALVHKRSHPHTSTHAWKQHKHPDTTTLVYMHLKHAYGLLRGIHTHPTSSSCMQTVTHTRRHPLTRCRALIHAKALTRTQGQSQTQHEPTPYTTRRGVHTQTHLGTTYCSTPWAGVCTHRFSDSWTHVWTSCLCHA